jgi:hypothetical protein
MTCIAYDYIVLYCTYLLTNLLILIARRNFGFRYDWKVNWWRV